MGNCKLDLIYDRGESQKEVKLDDNDTNLINKLEENYNQPNPTEKYLFDNNCRMNNNNNILGKKMLNLKINNDKLGKEKSSSNDDELVIITPRLNNNYIGIESYSNEITDEFTIKNETLVYINDNTYDKSCEIKKSHDNKSEKNKINKESKITRNGKNKNRNSSTRVDNSNKVMKKKINKPSNNHSKNNNNIKNKNGRKKNISKGNKISDSKILNQQIIQNNNYTNLVEQKIPSNKITNMDYYKINDGIEQDIKNTEYINNLKQGSRKYTNQRKTNSKKNSKAFNKSYNINNNNFRLNPIFDSFQFPDKINDNNNPQSSTLEKKNLELKNLLLLNLPLINSNEIIPNIKRKTYKEDLDSPQIEGNNRKINKINKDFDFENINMKVPIFKRKTDFHIRNKSYNKFNFFNNNMTNDNGLDNNFFSLFNNSSNLSINFIHNKFNKTLKNMQQLEPIMDNKNIISERNNKSCCNKKVNMKSGFEKRDNKKSNPFFVYKNPNKKGNSNKKIKNKSSDLQKEKKGLSNSHSYNNILQQNKNDNNKFNNTNANNNNMVLSSEQNSDMIELYIPKTQRKSLISNEIINKAGNKFIFSYENLDMFDTKQILYDGIIYKVINSTENSEIEYKFLERYFQISKNCFKYYNNINEAINEQEKPLVQFDVRHIQTIEIIENSFLGDSKINGNKNINILFCIYIIGNNDFFVFAHYNKYVGNNIINFLQFLIRYYEDNY